MTLAEFIKELEKVAKRQPAVNMIVRNDIFKLNAEPAAKYGVFAWTQGTHTFNPETAVNTFNFSLFYVDRLTDDKKNQVAAQSTAMQTLSNMLLECEAFAGVNAGNFQPFSQRFSDECAGMWVTVTFTVAATPCSDAVESEGDYNNDFNEDFKII